MYNIALIIYKHHHNLLPGVIESVFIKRQAPSTKLTRQYGSLQVPIFSRAFNNSLAVTVPRLYNSMLHEVTVNGSLHKYKKSLKGPMHINIPN